jgi:hypothetical protein
MEVLERKKERTQISVSNSGGLCVVKKNLRELGQEDMPKGYTAHSLLQRSMLINSFRYASQQLLLLWPLLTLAHFHSLQARFRKQKSKITGHAKAKIEVVLTECYDNFRMVNDMMC